MGEVGVLDKAEMGSVGEIGAHFLQEGQIFLGIPQKLPGAAASHACSGGEWVLCLAPLSLEGLTDRLVGTL